MAKPYIDIRLYTISKDSDAQFTASMYSNFMVVAECGKQIVELHIDKEEDLETAKVRAVIRVLDKLKRS